MRQSESKDLHLLLHLPLVPLLYSLPLSPRPPIFEKQNTRQSRAPTSSLPHPFHSLTVKRVGFTERCPASGHEFTHAAIQPPIFRKIKYAAKPRPNLIVAPSFSQPHR